MPALTPVVEALDKVPEPLRQYYEAKDGKFHVILDAAPVGFVPAADLATANGKVIEFRDNNVNLMREIEPLRKLKTDLGDVDPVVAKTAVTELKTLKEKGVTKPDDITTIVQAAVQAAVKPLQEQLSAATTATAAERKRADDAMLRSVIGEKFGKVGGIPTATDYIILRAQDAFEVKDGKVVARANKFSAANPGNPLEIEEWMLGQTKESNFAFKPSTGSGAEGGGGNGPGAGLKAGQTELRDPTPQQLGDPLTAKGIKEGKIKIVYTNQ